MLAGSNVPMPHALLQPLQHQAHITQQHHQQPRPLDLPEPQHQHQHQHQQQQQHQHQQELQEHSSCSSPAARGTSIDASSSGGGSPHVHTLRRACSSSLDGTAGGAPAITLQGYRAVTPHRHAGPLLHTDGPQKQVMVPASYTFLRSPLAAGPSSPPSSSSTLSLKPPTHSSVSKVHSIAGLGQPLAMPSSSSITSTTATATTSSLLSSRREAQWHALYKQQCRQQQHHSHIGSCQASEDEESSDEHDAITKQLMAAVVQQESRAHRHIRHHSWHAIKDEIIAGTVTQPGTGTGAGAGGGGGGGGVGMVLPRTAYTRFSADERLSASDHPYEDEDGTPSPTRVRSSYHLQSGQAAVELFLRLGRARQTVDFSKRQANLFAAGLHGCFTVWEALTLLNELREYEAVLFKGMQQPQQVETSLHNTRYHHHHLHHHHHHHHHSQPHQHQPSPLGVHDSGSESATGSSGLTDTAPGGSGNAAVAAAAAIVQSLAGSSNATCAAGAAPGDGPSPDMSLLEHAFQTAELCRHQWPTKDHLHLAGLIHGIGKLLAHKGWGSQPQWAVCGESFPLGCRFSPNIVGASYFSANPDRRRRLYSTPTGMYLPHCGLHSVTMSWGADEYLYQVLIHNKTPLPSDALFVLRFRRCMALTRPGGTYAQLMDETDQALLPVLQDFQRLCEYRRRALPPTELDGTALVAYYTGLIEKYLPGHLAW